jgi:nitric oxide reductase NorD protein
MRATDAHSYTTLVARRLAVLRELDAELHAALQQAAPNLRGLVDHDAEFAALTDLIGQIAAEAPAEALALVRRLDSMPDALADLTGLRKWALHGLQRFRDDLGRRLVYFESEDMQVFADRRTETDTAHLLAQRDALLHYLAGFGFARHRIELHDPQHRKLVPPAPTVRDDAIRFPRRFSDIEPAQRAAWMRAVIAHAAAHLRFSTLSRPAGNRLPMLLALLSHIEDSRVERLMLREFPGLRGVWGAFHVATRQNAGFDFMGLSARLAHALHDPAFSDANPWVDKGRRLFEEAAAKDLHDAAAFDRVARLLAIDMEKMRLGVTQQYRPAPNYRDDNALLWNMNAQLPEDEARTVVREDFEMRPQRDLPPEVRQADVDLYRRTRYPEWDHRLEAVREDWATVIDAPRPGRRAALRHFHPPSRVRIRGLERTPDRALRLARLPEGDELDLNAAVDDAVAQRARLVPDGRIFRRHGRRRRGTAIVLLMDLSVSTRRFVPGSFTTVLDAEKRAASMVAQALASDRDRVAVHGFSSNGRHEVHYRHLKGFDEPFDAQSQAQLEQARGELSTRMGAALRHASSQLQGERADHKVILMLTDGEPSDVDVVEDDYLIADAHHAVTSAATQGIRTFCLTLDRRADAYVRRIFGARNYLIADRADAFTGQTGQALVKLIAQ